MRDKTILTAPREGATGKPPPRRTNLLARLQKAATVAETNSKIYKLTLSLTKLFSTIKTGKITLEGKGDNSEISSFNHTLSA